LLVGLLLGLGALARPASQAILPLVAGTALIRPGAWRPRLAAVGLVCLGFGLIVGPWMLRNRAVYGVLAISGGTGDSLVERVRRHDSGFDFHERTETGRDTREAQIRARIYELGETGWGVARIRQAVQAEFQLTDVQADAAMRDAALHVIRQQPGYYVQSTLAMFVRVVLGVERSLDEFWVRRANQEYAADPEAVAALTSVYHDRRLSIPVAIVFLVGTVRCLAGWRRGLALLPLIVLTQLLLYVALDGPVARYRYPMQPLITLVACSGLTWLLGTVASRAAGRWLGQRHAAAPAAN
jgi:hypothetical protein